MAPVRKALQAVPLAQRGPSMSGHHEPHAKRSALLGPEPVPQGEKAASGGLRYRAYLRMSCEDILRDTAVYDEPEACLERPQMMGRGPAAE